MGKKLDLGKDVRVGCESHFLDSGSFSLWTEAATYAKEHDCSPYKFYDTDAFWGYVDEYCKFVKKYKSAIDLFANVDVIPDRNDHDSIEVAAQLTFRNQQYIEADYGINPVPVVHFKEDLKWLARYARGGYEVIALGGLVGAKAVASREWLDEAFTSVLDPKGLPSVKLHGFGVTSYEFLIRYPWWSVDSASWTKVGAYGGILVPHRRHGEFCFFHPRTMAPVRPYLIKISLETSRKQKKEGALTKLRAIDADFHDAGSREGAKHYLGLNEDERGVLDAWLGEIGVPLGRVEGGEVVEYGVCSRHSERKAANLLFFEKLRKALPEWPWKFRHAPPKGLFF